MELANADSLESVRLDVLKGNACNASRMGNAALARNAHL
jgi:hypothetical protein